MTPDDRDIACKHLVEELTAYVEETMPAAERARFDFHLAYCDDCATYVEQVRATIARLGALPEPALPPEKRAAVLEAFKDWRAGQG
jgi:anti-sigma factor RsiW